MTFSDSNVLECDYISLMNAALKSNTGRSQKLRYTRIRPYTSSAENLAKLLDI